MLTGFFKNLVLGEFALNKDLNRQKIPLARWVSQQLFVMKQP